jgi:hypothetical protein
LQKGRYGGRRIYLDNSIKISYVNSEFQSAGGHDDAVARLRKCFLGSSSFVDGQRAV